MGLVAATFKLMPDSADSDLAYIKKEIESRMEVRQIREVPIAFGIKLIEVLLVFEDKEGIGSVEEKLRTIKGVASVESGDVTLI